MTYATTEELNEFMGLEGEIPNKLLVGSSRSLEVVGTGDSSTTRFYTDHGSIIDSTYDFYYGATEPIALAQPLTETTDYTIDIDDGILDLTGTGLTTVGTASIYGSYKYNAVGIPDSRLQTALDQAETELNGMTNTHFADGTSATPNYTQVTNEKHTGKGSFNRDYFLGDYPLPNVSCLLSGTASTGSATLNVDSTNGFLSSGFLGVGTNKIVYTGKSGSAFTGVSGITSSISNGSNLAPYVFEISATDSGTTPTWTVLAKDTDYDLDLETGKVHIFNWDINDSTYFSNSAPNMVPNRFRGTYIHGKDSIPNDVKRAEMMMASRDLLHMAVRKAHTSGMNEFNPAMIDVDTEAIQKIIDRYRSMQIKNT